jgi:hypothetical protein
MQTDPGGPVLPPIPVPDSFEQYALANRALWAATLALMTAFMRTRAPAHRYLLARRIARNFGALREQECFSRETRQSFSRLALRWGEKADALSPHPPTRGIHTLLRRWTARW